MGDVCAGGTPKHLRHWWNSLSPASGLCILLKHFVVVSQTPEVLYGVKHSLE